MTTNGGLAAQLAFQSIFNPGAVRFGVGVGGGGGNIYYTAGGREGDGVNYDVTT